MPASPTPRFPTVRRLLRLPAAAVLALVAALAGCTPDTATAPTTPAAAVVPRQLVVPTAGYSQVALGNDHACAIEAAGGALACWGDDNLGRATPPAGAYTQVSGGYAHTCAVRAGDGALACWGSNRVGQAAPPAGAYAQVSAGEDHTCAVRAGDGALACWGYNSLGQAAPPAGPFTQVDGGTFHTCAVRAGDGALACWGSNAEGQATPPAGAYTQVSAGYAHACAVQAGDGVVACWGRNTEGQAAPPAGAYAQVSAGAFYTCAVRAGDGAVACWGRNDEDQAAVPAGLTAVEVSAGFAHTCARRIDGSLTCWGRTDNGRTAPPAVPTTRVAPAATFAVPVTAVVAGQPFVLALTGARVPGYPAATRFTYQFDCGDGLGYAVASPSASRNCSATAAGLRQVRGKVIDQDGDATEYSTTVTVGKAVQAITFTPEPPASALMGGTLTLSAAGGASGNPVVFTALTPATCAVSGNTVTFAAVGACTVAADQAGTDAYEAAPRVTRTVAVRYAWTGFFAPVSNPPTVNVMNAGRAVPLKFALGGDQGLAILAAGSPSSQRVACAGGAPTGTVDQTVTAGSSTLAYDATTGQYTYVWKTERAWAGSCRRLTLTLADGSAHTALFQFR